MEKEAPSSADHTHEWQQLVGQAMLRFGDIEYVSIMCLQHLPQDKIANSASKLPFSRRADLLVEMLEARSPLSAHLAALIKGFKRARTLAETRNLIAHNPLLLTLYFDEDMEKVASMEHVIASRNPGGGINLEELKEFAAEVDSLASEMWHAFLNETGRTEAITRAAKNKKQSE